MRRRARSARCGWALRWSIPSRPRTACRLRLTRYQGGSQRPGDPVARAGRLQPDLLDRHHRHQPARIPLRPRLRRVAARLPQLHRAASDATLQASRRRRGPQGLSGRGRQGARTHRRARRPDGGALLGFHHVLHGHAGRTEGRALGGLLADRHPHCGAHRHPPQDRPARAVVPRRRGNQDL